MVAAAEVAVTARRGAGHENVTVALADALQSFEQTLTAEQRSQYYEHPQKPQSGSVLRFVSEVDLNNQNRGRRCMASRLCTLLEAVQQFVSVVDTFFGANASLAALVWDCVTTAIRIASSNATYFETVSEAIMEIGRSCPAYSLYAPLYPGCIALQKALCLYYAQIVRFCTKAMRAPPKTLSTLISSLRGSAITDFEAEKEAVLDANKDVMQQLKHASRQVAVEKDKLHEIAGRSQELSWRRFHVFSPDGRRDQSELDQIRSLFLQKEETAMKNDIENRLSQIDHVKPWRQALKQRMKGTSEWFKEIPAYVDWRAATVTSVLWCPGTLGVGKTVFASSLIAHLHETAGDTEVITHHFCQSDLSASLKARTIMGTFARQLLSTSIQGAGGSDLQELHRKSARLELEDLKDFLLTRLDTSKTYYMVLDGLDECEDTDVRDVTSTIAQLCAADFLRVKVLVIGRPDLEDLFFGHKWNPHYRMPLSRQFVDEDIALYIAETLDECLQEKTLTLADPTLIILICDVLQAQSDGMFLWVRIFIDEICAQGSDQAILEALQNPPRRLTELLDVRLRRLVISGSVNEAIKLLQFCGVSQRPLSKDETLDLLGVSTGQVSFDRHKVPHDIGPILLACQGLVYMDEEDQSLHYVHSCVRQHLSSSTELKGHEFNDENLDITLGSLCVTYLDFSDFKTQMVKVEKGSALPIKPIDIGLASLEVSNSTTSSIARKLLRGHGRLQHLTKGEMERKVRALAGESESARLATDLKARFHFLEYAREFWVHHAANLDATRDRRVWSCFINCVNGEAHLAYRAWEGSGEDQTEAQLVNGALDWAVKNNHPALFEHFIFRSSCLTSSRLHGFVRKAVKLSSPRFFASYVRANRLLEPMTLAFKEALSHGREELLQLVPSIVREGSGSSHWIKGVRLGDLGEEAGVLECAAALGDLTLTTDLVERGYRWSLGKMPGEERPFAERLASSPSPPSDPAIWTVILASEIHSENPERLRETLQQLFSASDPKLQDILLQDISSRPTKFADLHIVLQMHAAMTRGDMPMAEALLPVVARSGNLDIPDRSLRTVLHKACYGGREELTRRLLVAGATLEVTDNSRDTPLMMAATTGELATVQILVDMYAVLDSVNAYGWTALHYASHFGHPGTVKFLLTAGANPELISTDKQTALHLSAASGHEAIVRILCQFKHILDQRDKTGRTALHAACSRRHTDIVTVLLSAGADEHLTDDEGVVALSLLGVTNEEIYDLRRRVRAELAMSYTP